MRMKFLAETIKGSSFSWFSLSALLFFGEVEFTLGETLWWLVPLLGFAFEF